jgi:hypothetical protein
VDLPKASSFAKFLAARFGNTVVILTEISRCFLFL